MQWVRKSKGVQKQQTTKNHLLQLMIKKTQKTDGKALSKVKRESQANQKSLV